MATKGETERGSSRKQKMFHVINGKKKNVMSAQTLEVYLLGVGTVLRIERDAWSMVK